MSRLPSLDGLRALSISLVLLGHAARFFTSASGPLFDFLTALSLTGVSVFFGISGFLITHLLVVEREREGRVDLAAFYLRRAVRILPPFFAFLGVLALVRAALGEPIAPRSLAIAAGFLWNYLSPERIFALGHTWSLDVEEQFYLLWPLAFALLGPRRSRGLAIALIAATPLLRAGLWFLVPASHPRLPYGLHSRLDTLMFGCLLALVWQRPRFRALALRAAPLGAPLAALFLFGLSPFLQISFYGSYLNTVGLSLEGGAIALGIFWAVSFGRHPALAATLGARPVVHLGWLSYSLYLSQQPFLDPTSGLARRWFPLTLLGAWLCAELSYRTVERLAARARTRMASPRALAPSSP